MKRKLELPVKRNQKGSEVHDPIESFLLDGCHPRLKKIIGAGFLEVDLVTHCGDSAEGFYLNTLSTMDVASGWSECVGVW